MRFVLSGFVCLLGLAVADVQAGSTNVGVSFGSDSTTYNNSHITGGLQDRAVRETTQKITGVEVSILIVGTGGSASFSQTK